MNGIEKSRGSGFPDEDASERLRLELPRPSSTPKTFPVLGILLGAAAGILIGHPMAMVALNVQEYMHNRAPLELSYRILHSFSLRMWPMLSLYILSGAVFGAGFGIIYQKLVENRLRIEQLYQEFELQVASLRHHYKNMTIGIQGFSQRIKRKVTNLTRDVRQCHGQECPLDNCFCRNLPALEQDVNIMVETTQRLNETLGKELIFLKILTGSALILQPVDFYPVLKSAIQILLELRFRNKQIEVLINGQPYETCRDSLVFNFSLPAMQVILENILSNAMKYGDKVQIVTIETNDKVTISIMDNGPGFEIGELKKQLSSLLERRETESTRSGIESQPPPSGKVWRCHVCQEQAGIRFDLCPAVP